MTKAYEKDVEFMRIFQTKFPEEWRKEFAMDTSATADEKPPWHRFLSAGPPETTAIEGVYYKCSIEKSQAENPVTLDEIEAQRLFSDFKIITEEDGGYRECGKLLNKLGHMEGFDAMFTYRFS